MSYQKKYFVICNRILYVNVIALFWNLNVNYVDAKLKWQSLYRARAWFENLIQLLLSTEMLNIYLESLDILVMSSLLGKQWLVKGYWENDFFARPVLCILKILKSSTMEIDKSEIASVMRKGTFGHMQKSVDPD